LSYCPLLLATVPWCSTAFKHNPAVKHNTASRQTQMAKYRWHSGMLPHTTARLPVQAVYVQ